MQKNENNIQMNGNMWQIVSYVLRNMSKMCMKDLKRQRWKATEKYKEREKEIIPFAFRKQTKIF